MENSRIGIIGSGSWATAIAKIVTDNNHPITWWVRQESNIDYFTKRHHNPHYLRNTYFDIAKINFTETNTIWLKKVSKISLDCLIKIAISS
jgi:glycerol-3-phosphate dehydrogenase